MKKTTSIWKAILIILVFLTSCSSENDNTQLSIEKLLTQKESWTFDHYEHIKIVEGGNSNFTKENIENQINSTIFGQILTFIENGEGINGYTFVPDKGIESWKWKAIDNSTIEVNFFNPEKNVIYENVNVNNDKLIYEFQNEIDIDGVIGIIYGKYIYK